MFRIRLKTLRENMGLSQYKFADEIGVAQSTVGMWESGKREPDFHTAQILADFFNVSIDYLVGRTDETSNEINAPPPSRGAMEDDFIERLEILSPAEQQEALGYLDFLVHRRNSDTKAP